MPESFFRVGNTPSPVTATASKVGASNRFSFSCSSSTE